MAEYAWGMPPPEAAECSVVELRQYTLRPGQRDVLIELFDREFVESQESAGMSIVGQFRDTDRPDRFVWIRGFADMQTRRGALASFYGGPVWKANAAAANATMIDVDDVLLLRPALPGSGFGELPPRTEPGTSRPTSIVAVTVCSLPRPADRDVLEQLAAALAASEAPPLALFVEEPSPNDFPALPVREGEHVVVWVQRTHGDRNDAEPTAARVLPDVQSVLQLRLEPTPRSRLR
jgi:hypothetical protein